MKSIIVLLCLVAVSANYFDSTPHIYNDVPQLMFRHGTPTTSMVSFNSTMPTDIFCLNNNYHFYATPEPQWTCMTQMFAQVNVIQLRCPPFSQFKMVIPNTCLINFNTDTNWTAVNDVETMTFYPNMFNSEDELEIQTPVEWNMPVTCTNNNYRNYQYTNPEWSCVTNGTVIKTTVECTTHDEYDTLIVPNTCHVAFRPFLMSFDLSRFTPLDQQVNGFLQRNSSLVMMTSTLVSLMAGVLVTMYFMCKTFCGCLRLCRRTRPRPTTDATPTS